MIFNIWNESLVYITYMVAMQKIKVMAYVFYGMKMFI